MALTSSLTRAISWSRQQLRILLGLNTHAWLALFGNRGAGRSVLEAGTTDRNTESDDGGLGTPHKFSGLGESLRRGSARSTLATLRSDFRKS